MTREELCILNNVYEASVGRAQNTTDLFLNRALHDPSIHSRLIEKGYVDASGVQLTDAGKEALEPYRVDSVFKAGKRRVLHIAVVEVQKAVHILIYRFVDRNQNQTARMRHDPALPRQTCGIFR